MSRSSLNTFDRRGARTKDEWCLPEASEVLKSFQRSDVNGNGAIDVDELAILLETLNPNITTEAAKKMFAAADIDGDNRVDFGEFMEFLFSDFRESESFLAEAIGVKRPPSSNGLKKPEDKVNEDTASEDTFDIEKLFKLEFSNAFRCFVASYPDSAGIATKYIEDKKRWLMSQEFKDRMTQSFGARLDGDGNGTLSYEEVRIIIREVLSADRDSALMGIPPSEVEIRKYFDTYNTAEFGKEMGSSAFVNLMRALNIHLIANNLPALQKKWRSETRKEVELAKTKSTRLAVKGASK